MSSHCQLTTSTGNLWVVINFQLIESELPCLLPWPSGACKWPDDWGCAISFYWGTCTPYTSYTFPHIDGERGRGGQALSQKLPMSGEAACAECGSHFDLIAFSPSHSRSSSRSRSRSRSLFVVCLFD